MPLPGLPGSTIPSQVPVYSIEVSANAIFDVHAAVGSPANPVALAVTVNGNVVRGSAAQGDPGLDFLGFHENSQIYFANYGHCSAKGGNGASHNQLSRGAGNLPSVMHVPGGGGGAGSPGGTGGLGSQDLAGGGRDPGGLDGNNGSLLTGGAGQDRSSNDPFYLSPLEPFWSDSISLNPDTPPEDGSPAIRLKCKMLVFNYGIIAGSAPGGLPGIWDVFGATGRVGGGRGYDLGETTDYVTVGGYVTDAQYQSSIALGGAPFNANHGKAFEFGGANAEVTFAVGGVQGVDLYGDVG